MFRVMPCHPIRSSPPKMLAGMEMLVTSVGRALRRNRNMTPTANKAPRVASRSRLSIEARICGA